MKRLAELVAPLGLEAFFEEHWRKTPHLGHGAPDRHRTLFGADVFCARLRDAAFADPRVRLLRGGAAEPEARRAFEAARESWQAAPTLESLASHCGGATTVVIDAIQEWHEPARSVCRELVQETSRELTINAYFGAATEDSGLGPHWDNQEVFILQLQGARRWRVAPPTLEEPVFPGEGTAPSAWPHAYDLEPGSVLYLPRGWWHYPRSGGAASLHLTVTLPCWTPADVARWCAEQLLEDARFRVDLALGVDPGAANEAMLAQIHAALEALGELAGDRGTPARFALERFAKRVAQTRPEAPPPDDSA